MLVAIGHDLWRMAKDRVYRLRHFRDPKPNLYPTVQWMKSTEDEFYVSVDDQHYPAHNVEEVNGFTHLRSDPFPLAHKGIMVAELWVKPIGTSYLPQRTDKPVGELEWIISSGSVSRPPKMGDNE